jgi:threonine dehydratase
MDLTPPTLRHVLEARQRLAGVLRPTALIRHPLLVDALGLDVYVKHENHNPTCAFKVRGGLNLVASLSPDERAAGVVTATTGNHGQSVALACERFGVPCTIVVPLGNNPEKNAAMRAYGATLVEHGRDFDESREMAERIRRERGLRYVHSANEPLLVAGVATYALEIFEELPDVGTIFVPIGGGSGASGLVVVRDALGGSARVVGVQAQGADAFARSWRGPARVVGDRIATFAEGLATRVTFDLTFGILRQGLEDVVLLSEDELQEGVRLALRSTHNLAEGAGAASIMAALRWRDRLRDQKVVCVMSGGNLDAATLARVLSAPGHTA